MMDAPPGSEQLKGEPQDAKILDLGDRSFVFFGVTRRGVGLSGLN